jgi:recombination protein RecA
MARRKPAADESAADFAPELPPKHPGAKIFADIAASTESFRPARETLKRVRAVPTIFPDVDRKTRVGGWPIERVSLVHGPSAAGKTLLCHGVGLSFLQRGHMYNFVDAELTTPITWLEQLFGPHADSSAFLASRPTTYEQAVDDIRKVAEGLAEAREKERVPPHTSALFVVDSIRKLVPKDLMKRIEKMGATGDKGSVDGYGGGAARLKANLNASWLDELGPLMYRTGCAIILVGRESDDATASARDRQFGSDWKLTGGKALFFDSSLVVRVSLAGKVKDGAGEDAKIVGERHLVEIHKTKVSEKQDRVEKAYFHTTARGFDRARDILRIADELGVIKKSGTWLTFDGHRWQGEARFAEKADEEVLDAIEASCRAKFDDEAKQLADHV